MFVRLIGEKWQGLYSAQSQIQNTKKAGRTGSPACAPGEIWNVETMVSVFIGFRSGKSPAFALQRLPTLESVLPLRYCRFH